MIVMSPLADVLILCKDLMLSSQIHGAIQRAGRKGRTCLSVGGCLQQLAAGPIAWLIVDLETPELDVVQLKAAAGVNCRLIGYAPHVRDDLFEAAESAGWTAVLTRGQAVRKVESLLAQ